MHKAPHDDDDDGSKNLSAPDGALYPKKQRSETKRLAEFGKHMCATCHSLDSPGSRNVSFALRQCEARVLISVCF